MLSLGPLLCFGIAPGQDCSSACSSIDPLLTERLFIAPPPLHSTQSRKTFFYLGVFSSSKKINRECYRFRGLSQYIFVFVLYVLPYNKIILPIHYKPFRCTVFEKCNNKAVDFYVHGHSVLYSLDTSLCIFSFGPLLLLLLLLLSLMKR